jgi:hypothetical protein
MRYLRTSDLRTAQDEMMERSLQREEREYLADEALDAAKQSREIREAVSRADVPTCLICQQQLTTFHPKTGEILPCKKCQNKKKVLRKMGSSLKQLSDLMRKQDDRCAICDKPFDNNRTATAATIDMGCRPFEQDYVRGAVHNACKEGLRCFSDNPETAQNLVDYLAYAPAWYASKHSPFRGKHLPTPEKLLTT